MIYSQDKILIWNDIHIKEVGPCYVLKKSLEGRTLSWYHH